MRQEDTVKCISAVDVVIEVYCEELILLHKAGRMYAVKAYKMEQGLCRFFCKRKNFPNDLLILPHLHVELMYGILKPEKGLTATMQVYDYKNITRNYSL